MRSALAASLFLILGAAGAAHAAPSCKGISVTSLAFGNYDVYSATPLDSVATLSYSCPPPAVPRVDISAGASGSFSPRAMTGPGGERLQYNVYSDSAMTQVWDSTPIQLPQGNGSSVSIYGRVFAQQDVPVGTYTDTLVVTFNF